MSPTTKAGRALLAYQARMDHWHVIDGRRDEYVTHVRHIEAETDAKWEAALSVLRVVDRDAVLAAVKR